MKKFLPIYFALILIGYTLLGIHFQDTHNQEILSPTHSQTKSGGHIVPVEKAFADEPKPSFYPPKQLIIPKIGVNAEVLSVGLDSEKRMDVPNDFVHVGWYNLGPRIGEVGSVVLDGHSDDFHGNPGVFYYLDQLEVGDTITVIDESNREFTYTVTDKAIYPLAEVPLQQIFGLDDKARLNIITCHGQWDDALGTYNQRTVIYSELLSGNKEDKN